jgi:hypothetical protein
MTSGRPRVTGVMSPKTRLREPDAAAGGDFVWPPPADDPAACSIVMLDARGDLDAGPRTTALADGWAEAFPDIDVESALDAFADRPSVPRIPATIRPALSPSPQRARPATSRWWAAALRSIVALCIGASLALMPAPPGLQHVVEVRAAAAPAIAEPRPATARRIRRRDAARVAPKSGAEPQAGRIVARDEERIRTTLAQLRTAYAQLDASAAREVWPSVDADALTRAFGELTSQELRFDHCDVTVDGARARAACTGKAVYVPRVGDAVSGSSARAWTFELTRMRERWMIASARAS